MANIVNNKISRNLSGPDRWKKVNQIMGQKPNKDTGSKGFADHDFSNWTNRQKEAYASIITGIKPNQGSNRDRRAGRTKGRYIKGNI